jgi:pSer/pThr/pTyr-binding forkhead associated (FHA) protein
MTGRLVVRTGAGAIEEHPLRPRLTIGSTAPSDVVVEGAGVLPLHATVAMHEGRCWIEAAGGGTIAINGHPVDRHALRHLDVITLGGVHLIFCASTARPEAPQTQRAAVVPPARAEKTVHGVPLSAFKPQEPSSNQTVGIPAGGPPPAFSPSTAQTTRSPVVPPSFRPGDTDVVRVPVHQAITSVRLRGSDVVYEAPNGASVIGRRPDSTIRIDRPEVSRTHAMVNVSATRVTIADASSARGTIVNGKRISGTHVLAEGDVVTIGKLDFRVEFVRAGGAP